MAFFCFYYVNIIDMIGTYNTDLKLRSKMKNNFAFLKDIHSLFYFVLLLIITGFLFFGFALITEKFTTPYSGDFSQQAYQAYYNFYDDWWTFFKTGQFPFYDSNTFLGADNIFANTYYGLFSPFTFPILFVPRSFIPQMMSLISIARLVVGGLFFRMYLKYMGASETSSRLFTFAYAFMGWMAYYLWFNPFYEVLTFFPLILFGIEKVVRERKPLFVILGFFLLGISNYFFLLTSGIFGVTYGAFRFFQTIKTRSAKESWLVILVGFFGFLFGYGLAMFCVYPALISSFSINRASESKYLSVLTDSLKQGDFAKFFKIFFTCWSSNITNYGSPYEEYYFSYVYPLCSYFYPTVSDRFTNIMHYEFFENTGSSIFIYTPSMILMGCSIYLSIKQKKISHLFAMLILIACLFIPFFYFLCGAFVTAYGRWEIVVPIIALTYIALNYDRRSEVPWYIVVISGVATLAFMLLTFFLSQYIVNNYSYFIPTGDMIFLVIYQIVLTVAVTGLLVGFWKKKCLSTIIKTSFICEITVVGTLVANIHGLQSISTSVAGGYNDVPNEIALVSEINKNDNSYFRLQSSRAYEGNSNLGMIENFNGTGCFHTFYNNDLDDFLRFSQIMMNDSAWNGVTMSKRCNLDEFLGVKYYVSKDTDMMFNYYSGDNVEHVVFDPNIPLNYERIESSVQGYRVYKNKYHLNLGTSYDTLYFKNECGNSIYNSFYPYSSSTDFVIRNEEAYFSGAILNNDDVYKVMSQYGDNFAYEQAPKTYDVQAKTVSIKLPGIYVNKDGNYFDPKLPDRDINEESKIDPTVVKTVNRYQLVVEPSKGKYFPLGEDGSYFMLDYPIRQSSGNNYSATVYLIGEDNNGNSKVITFDNCRDFSRSSGRSLRGLYSKEKVKRMIICVDGDKYVYSLGQISLYYEPFEQCISRYETAISNGLNDVTYNVNTFSFNTNYSKPRFVVTQLAYTGGWKVYATDESGTKKQLNVYNAQGGFAGFVAPSGKMKYTICYQTKNLDKGIVISVISLFGGAILTCSGYVIKTIKRKKEIN